MDKTILVAKINLLHMKRQTEITYLIFMPSTSPDNCTFAPISTALYTGFTPP